MLDKDHYDNDVHYNVEHTYDKDGGQESDEKHDGVAEETAGMGEKDKC